METAVSITLKGEPASVPEARCFTRGVLAGHDVPAPCEELVALLVSEIVTNAVLHAGGEVRLLIEVGGRSVRVGVRDGDPRVPAPVAPRKEGGGFGLWLLDHLAAEWSVESHADGTGKTVWFTVPRAGEPAHGH